MSTLIWLHEDALRADHPVFAQAGDAIACFIWDDAYLAAQGYGLKRRVFIYESLLALPVEIVAGPLVETLASLVAQHGATQIYTAKTPNPDLKAVMQAARAHAKLTSVPDTGFVQMDAQPELKRFFKYWNKAKKKAFLYDGRS